MMYFIEDWCWRGQLTISSATPGLVSLGTVRNQAKQVSKQHSPVASASFPVTRFLPAIRLLPAWVPALTFFADGLWYRTVCWNKFFPSQIALVLIFITAIEAITNTPAKKYYTNWTLSPAQAKLESLIQCDLMHLPKFKITLEGWVIIPLLPRCEDLRNSSTCRGPLLDQHW